MVLQKILKSDHIRSCRVMGNILFKPRWNNHLNPRGLHLPYLRLEHSVVNRSQKEP